VTHQRRAPHPSWRSAYDGRPASDSRAFDGTRKPPATLCLVAITIVALGFTSGAVAEPTTAIIDKPLQFGERREKLTIAYRRLHEDPQANTVRITPRVIVIHHTGGRSLTAAWRNLNRVTIAPHRRGLVKYGRVNVSAHFLVGRDGRIYRLMPDNRFARHCIGLNHLAIGIENVGGITEAPLTRAQVSANVRLVRQLAGRHDITHLIGHHEYRAFEGHPYFRERLRSYRTRKRDPGARFMRQLRRQVDDLELDGPPLATRRLSR
jgi:hypothetical protein